MTVPGQDRSAPEIRVSDEEREQVVRRLTEAVGEGRLTLDEFTHRVDTAYAATTYGELDAVTADLPVAAARRPGPVAMARRRWRLSLLGGSELKGRWPVPARSGFFAVMGGSKIDLCAATLPGPYTEIVLVSIMGGHEVIVPHGVRAEVDGISILGGNDIKVEESPAAHHAPVVHLRTYSLMGGNAIRNPEGSRRR